MVLTAGFDPLRSLHSKRLTPRLIRPSFLIRIKPIRWQLNIFSEAMADKTLREFSAPSTKNIHTRPTVKTKKLEFELKPSLINMMQATPFSGKAHEDASAHL